MDKNEVLKALAHEWGIEEVKENEFTRNDMLQMMKDAGYDVSENYVGKKIKSLTEAGILQGRSAKRPFGGKVNAYSPAEGKSWEDVLQYIKVS